MELAGAVITPSSGAQIAAAGVGERAAGGGNEADADGATTTLGPPREKATAAREAMPAFRLRPAPLPEAVRATHAPPARDETAVVQPPAARPRTDTTTPVAPVPLPRAPLVPRGPRNTPPHGRTLPTRAPSPRRTRADTLLAMADTPAPLKMRPARGPTRPARPSMRPPLERPGRASPSPPVAHPTPS